jgi:membrane glycosyltransferase
VAFALAGVFSLLNAPTWYLILGASIMLAAGALFVARAITSLRAGESTTSK